MFPDNGCMHMQINLNIFSLSLTEDEVDTIENIGLGG